MYALNDLECRKSLWQELVRLAAVVQESWLVLGDLNNVLCSEDIIGGSIVTDAECVGFLRYAN